MTRPRPAANGGPPPLRRALLAAAAALACAPWLGACSAGFDVPSTIKGVRVLNVVVDKPYAEPGDTVRFTMTVDATAPYDEVPLQILWIGGCFDPPDDLYYACYDSFQTLIDAYQSGTPPPSSVVGFGETFSLTLPDTIIVDHEPDATGEVFGLGYVFFAACAGTIAPVPVDPAAGDAGSFPLGCFDAAGNRLPAEAFVPGFTQVYAFGDHRTNANPQSNGLLVKLDSEDDSAYVPMSTAPTDATTAAACTIDEDARKQLGCGKDPFTDCTAYSIDIDVDESIAELDPDPTPDGTLQHEAVWVDWYADAGDFDGDVSLLYDPRSGLNPGHAVRWIAPPTKGIVTFWGAVHDARGGGSIVQGYIDVQ